jgi:hypothetical protein
MIGLYPIMCCGAAPSWDLRGRCPDDYLVRMRDLDTGALEESDSKLFRTAVGCASQSVRTRRRRSADRWRCKEAEQGGLHGLEGRSAVRPAG